MRHQGLWWVKGKTMPTHKGSYIFAGQKDVLGETTKVKSQALLKSRLHIGAISRGKATT